MMQRLFWIPLVGACFLACSKQDAGAHGKTAAPAPAANPEFAAPPANATKLPSGVAIVVTKPGTGTEHPGDYDEVKVNMTVWTTAGVMFDSTTKRTQPDVLPMAMIPSGWKQALQQLVVGEKARVWVPKALAFNDRPGAPPGTNVLDLEVLEIVKKAPPPAPPPAPPDVAAAPADAEKLDGNVMIKRLAKGAGSLHPKPTDTVTVQYTGWTTDGKMFDSSIPRGSPATFPLTNLIDGWKIGIPTMVQGEKARLWIPQDKAYKGMPGKPAGMLVFDIELLNFAG